MCETTDYLPMHLQVMTSGGFEVDAGIVLDIEFLLGGQWTTQWSCQGEGVFNHRYIVLETDQGQFPDPNIFDWCHTVTLDIYDGVERATFSSDDAAEVVTYTDDKIVWTR